MTHSASPPSHDGPRSDHDAPTNGLLPALSINVDLASARSRSSSLSSLGSDLSLIAPSPPHATNGHDRYDSPGTINVATNGYDSVKEEDDSASDSDGGERPSKRRRTRDATPPNPGSASRRPKPISPPWKKFEADGPTTFTDNGKRRSGRSNALSLQSQPPSAKRMPRRVLQEKQPSSAFKKTPSSKGVAVTNSASRRASASKAAVSNKIATHPLAKSSPHSQNVRASNAPASTPTGRPSRTRRRSPSPPPPTHNRSLRARRSSRNMREPHDSPGHEHDTRHSPDSRSAKARPHVNKLSAIPIVHPSQLNVFPGQTLPRSKVGADFADYLTRADTVNLNDGGWLDPAEDVAVYTEELAQRDAQTLVRAEKETQPGGLLSLGRSSLFVPDAAEEPPRQWAHADHLVKQMANFRKLMLMEQQRHKSTAKRLAEACRDEWIRRQPKSAEQIEAEARALWIARYRLVARVLGGTWENVKTEVNRRRLEEWEAAEQKRVKAALNEAVSMSEMKLQARQARADSELLSDESEDDMLDSDLEEDEIDNESGDAQSEQLSESEEEPAKNNEDNMSSDEDEDDVKSNASDEGLTQDQLRQKYANVPDLPNEEPEERAREDSSDESIDMDDDMGSSDEDEEDEGEDEDEGEEDDGQPGLLGMLFGKSELKKMKETEDVEMQDATGAEMQADADPTGHANDAEVHKGPGHDNTEVLTNGHAIGVSPAEAHEGLTNDSNTELTNGHAPASPADANHHEQPGFEVAAKPLTNGHTAAEVSKAAELETGNDSAMDLDHPERPVAPAPTTDQPERNAVKTNCPEAPGKPSQSVIPSVEVTAAEPSQASPDTSAVTNPSRDRSASPRTSDTKPSEVDTAASTVKTVVSRSASPHAQVPKTEAPFLLRGSLREYQHYGLDWLAGLYQNKTNGILADEMGLGKTIQTIALLAHLACHHEVWGPHLVIVPTSVMLNWEMEFKKWCPGFKVLSYYGSIEERKRKRQGWKTDDMWNVCITSYQIVLQDQQVFKRRQWHYMILDEAHNIKNFKSKRWQTLLGFNTRARLLLTGTPLQNNLTELWSLLFFLMPSENGVGGFADLAEFQDWFHKPESQILESGREQMDEEARAIIFKLHKVLRPYLLRRLKADVEKQMPGKYEHVEFCRLSRRQRELYDGFLARADTRESLASGNYISVINCLMQLRKVCNHPDLFVERPIMTSFRQPKSVVADFESTNQVVRKKLAPPLMQTVDINFLNMVPTRYESLSSSLCASASKLAAQDALSELRDVQRVRAQMGSMALDPSMVESNIEFLERSARWSKFQELQHCVYVNSMRRQQQPIYGKQLIDMLTVGVDSRPHQPKPKVPQKIMSWFEEDSPTLRSMVPTLDRRAEALKTTISKFACVTPAVVTRDLDRFVLGSAGVAAFGDEDLRLAAPVRRAPFLPKEAPVDPWHESRMRLSIQFPDKRLLQYDCGKLQALDRLLRKLQSGGHRALIFTQMTKVLDILEQFLNIHGHKYLRLDGATKIEQRQILTDRFNSDNRILCFILSTRSGGLGINLTGADTVIFYDQDWNPAMDKQCQDRCHRIGQTRDVHIYRLVSEHTIEANILRKASQKQMLDDVVIQEGGFTTDYFNKMSVRDVIGGATHEADVVGDAMDRVLGGVENSDQRTVGRALAQAEDREDIDAARVAEKEIQEDEAEFDEKPASADASGATTTQQGTPAAEKAVDSDDFEQNAWGDRVKSIDDFMLATMGRLLEGTALELPRDKKKSKSKKGRDHRKR